jgi:hypothetical protein
MSTLCLSSLIDPIKIPVHKTVLLHAMSNVACEPQSSILVLLMQVFCGLLLSTKEHVVILELLKYLYSAVLSKTDKSGNFYPNLLGSCSTCIQHIINGTPHSNWQT